MATLTETEMKKISRLQQRGEAVRRLAAHFTWSEFGEEAPSSVLRRVHQRLVADVALFTAARGFPWSDVVRAAAAAKDVFPRLVGLDVPAALGVLDEAQGLRLAHLSPPHGAQLRRFLAEACAGSQRLVAAAVAHASTASTAATQRAHLEVQVPPVPLPLSQGLTLEEAELQRRQAELTAALRCTEHQLQALRAAPGAPRARGRPEGHSAALLDAEGVQELVRSVAEQVAAGLRQEATLVAKLLELKLQCTVGATRRSPAPTPRAPGRQTRPAPSGRGRRRR